MEPLGELRRTHTCGALRASEVGQNVVLLGWVHRVRDLGSLIFLDIRDRAGVTQAVVGDDEAMLASAKRLRTEMAGIGVARIDLVDHIGVARHQRDLATGNRCSLCERRAPGTAPDDGDMLSGRTTRMISASSL